ncbi:MAG: ATP-binding protein, partial [Candidatus Aminicenantes bacterium]|nr:ATP-binding protein [Candidatus Aminicenantes bacterium]
FLLYQVMDEIRKVDKDAVIIYINRELYDFSALNTHEELYSYVKARTERKKKNYLFIDEIQTVSKFEHAIKSLLAEGNYDIYITGSNADLLSGEFATLLGGRTMEFTVYPLSYKEFLVFHELTPCRESMEHYVRYGGLPYLRNLPLEDVIIFDYLRNIYQSILYRDVVSRFEIRNVTFLNTLVIYLAANSGTLLSARNISNYLKSQRTVISIPAIISYLDFLNKAFFTIKVSRSDIRGKKIFEVGEKHYFNDTGIRNAIVGFNPGDMGLILENMVFNHLISSGFRVFTGKSGEREIDFIAERRGERKYIQATLTLGDQKTLDREFGNLLAIKDQYPKIVVSMEKSPAPNTYLGIQNLSLLEFLME